MSQTNWRGISLWRGGRDSTVTRTCQATGEAVLVPGSNAWSKVSRITGTTGKSTKDETVAAGSVLALKRGNARGAKGPCCTQLLRQDRRGRGEPINSSVILQELRRRIYVKAKAIGPITLDAKCAGARSAGNPHAACEEAGAGNGFTVRLVRHSQRKRGVTDRPRLRSTAPALDPTGHYETYSTEQKVIRRILDHLDKQEPRAPPSKNLDSDSASS